MLVSSHPLKENWYMQKLNDLNKKNIAILIRALDHGGAERCASNLSFDLSRYYNVHLIVFDGREMMYPYEGILHNLNIVPQNGILRK